MITSNFGHWLIQQLYYCTSRDYSCNGFRNVFHIRNNDHWPLQRITLLPCLLVPLGLNLAPHFVESPLRIPACRRASSTWKSSCVLSSIFVTRHWHLPNKVLTVLSLCSVWWWEQLPTEPCIRPLSWHGVFPSCQEAEELSTSFFWWRPLIEVETSSFR